MLRLRLILLFFLVGDMVMNRSNGFCLLVWFVEARPLIYVAFATRWKFDRWDPDEGWFGVSGSASNQDLEQQSHQKTDTRKCRGEWAALSESLSKSESDNVFVYVDESGLMSRFCPFPSTKSKNKFSLRSRQRHTSQAESPRKALVSDLMSHDTLDVKSMVDKANIGFASLSSHRNDFGDLYDAVRAFIVQERALKYAGDDSS